VAAPALTLILLVTLGALAVGLVGNHFFRQKEPGKTAVEVKDLVAPIGSFWWTAWFAVVVGPAGPSSRGNLVGATGFEPVTPRL
jgi:hypothetical protein